MNAITRACAPAFATALALGCVDVTSPPVGRAALGSRSAAWVPDTTAILFHGAYSGLGDSARLVIRDSGTWAAIWTQLATGRQPQPPLPSVDFGTERVLLAALGQRNTGGYDIRIDSLVRYERGSVAYVTTRAPGRSCGTTQALTQPVEIVRLAPLPLEPVAFDQQAVVIDCADVARQALVAEVRVTSTAAERLHT